MKPYVILAVLIVALNVNFALGDDNAHIPISEPLTIDTCIEIALSHHPACLAAHGELESAEAGVDVVRSVTLPQIGVGGTFNHNSYGSSRDGTRVGANVRQLIYDGGRSSAHIRDARAQAAVKLSDHRRIQQSVVLGVRKAYYSTLAAKQLEDAVGISLQRAQLHLEAAKARYDEGLAPKSDVTRASVSVAQAELELIRAQNRVKVAYAELSNAMGLPEYAEFTLVEQSNPAETTADLWVLLEEGRNFRPELHAAESQILTASAKAQAAAATPGPSIYATAGHEWVNSSPGSRSGLTLGLGVDFSLWDGGEARSRVKQADALVTSAESNYAQAAHNVELEIRQAHARVTEADKRMTVYHRLIEQAEENYRIAHGRYNSGLGSMIEVVDAQTALTDARIARIEVMYDALSARAELDRATGRDHASRETL